MNFLKGQNNTNIVLELPYPNAKLETSNNLFKVIKRNVFSFWNFDKIKNAFPRFIHWGNLPPPII